MDMKRFKGRLFLTVLRGLVASDVLGADFRDVSITSTTDGLRLSCLISSDVLRETDADAREAGALLVSDNN